MPCFIIERNRCEDPRFANPRGAFYIDQYFFAEKEVEPVFQHRLHIHHDPRRQAEFCPAGDVHEGVELEFAEVAVVYIHITIHFLQIHPETVWVVVHQVHCQDGLVKTHGLNPYVFHIAVIESLGFGTGEQE